MLLSVSLGVIRIVSFCSLYWILFKLYVLCIYPQRALVAC